MAKLERFLGLILAILLVGGAFPTNSAHAQVGCSQEAVVINPPATGTFDSRFNATPVAPAGFMAVLFTGVNMPGEPQKAMLLRSGATFTYASGVFYAVCSGDLRGLAVGHGWWDLYVRGNYLSPVEVWDMIVSPGIRLVRWEAYTPILAPVPVPSPYPYPVPQPVPAPLVPIPYPQPAPMPIAFLPQPIQPCGPLNYTPVSPETGRVYGAAVVRVKFRDYALKVIRSIAGDQTALIREAETIEVWELPGCDSGVVGAVATGWVAQGGSVPYDSAPPEFQGNFSIVKR